MMMMSGWMMTCQRSQQRHQSDFPQIEALAQDHLLAFLQPHQSINNRQEIQVFVRDQQSAPDQL
jgi:hypothetical protein